MNQSNLEFVKESQNISGVFLYKFGLQEHLGFSLAPVALKNSLSSEVIQVSLLTLEGFPREDFFAELSLGSSKELSFSLQDREQNEERKLHLGRKVLKEFSLFLDSLEKLKDLRVCIREMKKEWEMLYSDVSMGHGWKGTMDYQAAKNGLRNVRTNDETKSIFFDLGEHAVLEARVLESSSDYTLYLRGASNETKAQHSVDMLQLVGSTKRNFKVFGKPIELIGGDKCISQVKIDKLIHPFSHKRLKLTLNAMKNTVLVAPLMELAFGEKFPLKDP